MDALQEALNGSSEDGHTHKYVYTITQSVFNCSFQTLWNLEISDFLSITVSHNQFQQQASGWIFQL